MIAQGIAAAVQVCTYLHTGRILSASQVGSRCNYKYIYPLRHGLDGEEGTKEPRSADPIRWPHLGSMNRGVPYVGNACAVQFLLYSLLQALIGPSSASGSSTGKSADITRI